MKTYAIALLFATACTPFDPDLGQSPYLCPDDVCPDGYTCSTSGAAKVCLAEGEDPGIPSEVQCIDDSGFGSNDTIQSAFPTPVQATNVMFAALAAVCPPLDKDNYSVNITAQNSNLEVTATVESGTPVNVQILNNGNNVIGPGTAIDGGFRACVPNLPTGTVYANVFGGADVKNNYRISIKIVPNC